MERISNISNTSKSNNNQKRSTNYVSARKDGMPIIDSLEYKKVLDTALEAKKTAKDVNKFKSLIERAGEKLTSQLTTAPLKENRYSRESNIMMANGGMAAKARVERKSLEELSKATVAKKAISSYSTSYGQYKRELENTNISYKNYEDTSKDTSKDSRGYKDNYSKYTKVKKSNTFNEFEDDTSFIEPTEKVSFWTKFKNAIKNFFKTEEKELVTTATVQPKLDKAAQYRKSVPKAAPQINKEEVERRRLQNIREMAIRSR